MPSTSTTKQDAIRVTQENLHLIFGEPDPTKRLSAISSLWVPSSDVVFIDPMGTFHSHKEISDMVTKLQDMGPGDVFSELDDVDVLQKDEAEDLWVTRLKWGIGPPGGDVKLTGEDVLTIVGGRIKACYTFLDSK